ncbi:MAG TPA: OmpA family protein [Gammaproteobacteria bacterium]|nr:OmpA family protein [Gammaproteobacteria bacterium]
MNAFNRIGAVSFLLGSLFLTGCNVMPSDQYQLNALNEDNDFKVIYEPERTLVILSSDEIFLLNTSKFRDDHRELLEKIGKFVAHQSKDLKIIIKSFSDTVPSPGSAKDTTQAQAEAIAAYLWSKGVEASRLSFQGQGASHPVSSNVTPEGSAQNRRIEISLG